MTFAEFITRAGERYAVRIDELRFDSGFHGTVLVRPIKGDDPRFCRCPDLRPSEKISAEQIREACEALGMKPHDFDLFIG